MTSSDAVSTVHAL